MPDFAVTTTFSVKEQLTQFFSKGEVAASKFETMVSGAFRRSGKQASLFGQVLGGVTMGNLAADGIRRAASGIKNLATEGLQLASDLIEVQNVVDTSFGPAGAAKVNTWSEAAAKGFGLSILQAKQFNGTMGAMLKSSGLAGNKIVEMSTGLSGLAGDFASFYNLDAADAFMKIRSGISGETEPLKQLGINMSVANMQAFALTQGIHKKWEKMKQAEQAELRYAYLMKVSKDAQGDFNKTLDTSYANQKRVLEMNTKARAADFMSAILPTVMKYTKEINSLVTKFGEWISANKNLVATKIEKTLDTVLWLVTNLGPPVLAGVLAFNSLKYAMLAAAFIGKGFALVNTIMFAFQAVAQGAATKQEALNMVMAANPLGLICAAIAIAVGLFVMLSKHMGGATNAAMFLGQSLLKFLLVPVNLVIDGIRGLLWIMSKIPGLGGKIAPALDAVTNFQNSMNKTLTGAEGQVNFGGTYEANRKAPGREAPNAAEISRSESSWSGRLDIAGAPEGSRLSQASSGPSALRADLMGANP